MNDSSDESDSWPFRTYLPEDRAACIELFESNAPELTERQRERFISLLAEPGGPFLVMTNHQGRVASCGSIRRSPTDSHIAQLRGLLVRRQWQDAGVGKRMYSALLTLILGNETFRYVAVEANQYSRGFFEHVGFEHGRVEEDGFGPGFERVELLLDLETLRRLLPKE